MRLFGLFSALLVIFLSIWLIWGPSLEHWNSPESIIQSFQNRPDQFGIIACLLLMSDLLLPIPNTIIMTALGLSCGLWKGILFAFTGQMLAGLSGYGVGRLFSKRLALKLLGEKDHLLGTDLLKKNGFWVIAATRALPLLPEALSVSAGLLKMPFLHFISALACGSFAVSVIFVAIGAKLGQHSAWALALSVLIPVTLWLVSRKITAKY